MCQDEVLTTAVPDDQVASFLQADGEEEGSGRIPDVLRHTQILSPHLILNTQYTVIGI